VINLEKVHALIDSLFIRETPTGSIEHPVQLFTGVRDQVISEAVFSNPERISFSELIAFLNSKMVTVTVMVYDEGQRGYI
jgi:hypothetical protein